MLQFQFFMRFLKVERKFGNGYVDARKSKIEGISTVKLIIRNVIIDIVNSHLSFYYNFSNCSNSMNVFNHLYATREYYFTNNKRTVTSNLKTACCATPLTICVALFLSFAAVRQIWMGVSDYEGKQSRIQATNVTVDSFLFGVQFIHAANYSLNLTKDFFVNYTLDGSRLSIEPTCPILMEQHFGSLICYRSRPVAFNTNDSLVFTLSKSALPYTNYTIYFKQQIQSISQGSIYQTMGYGNNFQGYKLYNEITKFQIKEYNSLLRNQPTVLTGFMVSNNSLLKQSTTDGVMQLYSKKDMEIIVYRRLLITQIISMAVVMGILSAALFGCCFGRINEKVEDLRILKFLSPSKEKLQEIKITYWLYIKQMIIHILGMLRQQVMVKKYFGGEMQIIQKLEKIRQMKSVENMLVSIEKIKYFKRNARHQNHFRNITDNNRAQHSEKLGRTTVKKTQNRILGLIKWVDLTNNRIYFSYKSGCSSAKIIFLILIVCLIGGMYFLSIFQFKEELVSSLQYKKLTSKSIDSNSMLYFDIIYIQQVNYTIQTNQQFSRNDSLYTISAQLLNENDSLILQQPITYNCTPPAGSVYQNRSYSFCIQGPIKLQNTGDIKYNKLKVTINQIDIIDGGNILFVGYFDYVDFMDKNITQLSNYTAGYIVGPPYCTDNLVKFREIDYPEMDRKLYDVTYFEGLKVCDNYQFSGSITYMMDNSVFKEQKISNLIFINGFGLAFILLSFTANFIFKPLDYFNQQKILKELYKKNELKHQNKQGLQTEKNVFEDKITDILSKGNSAQSWLKKPQNPPKQESQKCSKKFQFSEQQDLIKIIEQTSQKFIYKLSKRRLRVNTQKEKINEKIVS